MQLLPALCSVYTNMRNESREQYGRHARPAQISIRLAAHMKMKLKRIRKKLDVDPVHGPRRRKLKQAEAFRYSVYQLFDEPDSSTGAMVVFAIMMLLILLSVVCCIAETLPSLERDEDAQLFFWVTEIVVVLIFTVEYIVRFWATPLPKCKFICQPFNVIDVLAILPFYVTLIIFMVHGPLEGGTFESVMRLLRSLRLLRVLRLGKYSEDLGYMSEALYRSTNFFVILAFLLIALTLAFSSLIWIFERGEWDEKKKCFVRPAESHFSGCSPFDSVPQSSWWAIVTLSTVGYGDAFPISLGGRIVGGFAMFSGILAVALPTAVLGVEFIKHYQERLEEKKLLKMRQGLQTCSKDELILFTKLVDIEQIGYKLNAHIKFLKYLRLACNDEPGETHFLEGSMDLHIQNLQTKFQNVKRFGQLAGMVSEGLASDNV